MPIESSLNLSSVPFVVELRQAGRDAQGNFVPEARVLLGPQTAVANLLRELEPEAVELLLGVLSSVTANGDFVATPESLGSTFGVSPIAALERLRQASAIKYRGTPLLTESVAESRLIFFRPSRALFAVEHLETGTWLGGDNAGMYAPAGRDAVVDYSRARYGRPRMAVEAAIEAFYADEPEPVTPEDHARLNAKKRLAGLGLSREQAGILLQQFPVERIARQIEWLPYRNARNPAAYIVAAIEGNYEPPLALWNHQAGAVSVGTDDEEPAEPRTIDNQGRGGAEPEVPGLDGTLPGLEGGEVLSQ